MSLARQKREDMAKEQTGAETGPQKIEPWLNETVTLLNVEEPLDLGGRRLKLIHVPGHSGGCICILDEERGWLFTGDTCCEGDVLLNLQYSQKADVYLESLKKLEQEKFSVTWPAHHRVPVEPEIIQEFEEAAQLLCGKQAEGECVDTSFGPSRRLKHKRIGILYKDETRGKGLFSRSVEIASRETYRPGGMVTEERQEEFLWELSERQYRQ